MILDVIVEVCVACGGPMDWFSNFIGGGAAGSSGGPPPSEPADPSDPSDPPDPSDPTDPTDPPEPDPSDPPEPTGEDIAESVATGLAIDAALDVTANKGLPMSSGLLGVLGTLVSGSQTLAEGITAVNSSNGYGMGGGSKGGKESMEAAFREIRGETDPRLKKGDK